MVSQVTAGQGLNDKTVDAAFDAAGNVLTRSAYVASTSTTTTTTATVNPLDQVTLAVRSSGTWAKTNYDAAGNPTDRCLWTAAPSDPCKAAGSTFGSPQPASVTSATFDARNSRVTLVDAVANSTTTYDPDQNYQVWAIYLATGGTKEHQTIFGYDERHRLTSVTHQLCSAVQHPCAGGNVLQTTGSDAYAYDTGDNRTRVNEANGTVTNDRYYCYDAVERLVSTRSASGCSSGLLDAYTYDDSGNRKTTSAVTFTYNGSGQLASCTSGCGTVTHDSAGRMQKLNGWFFEYDAAGRLIHACLSTSCTGSITKVEYAYDGDGHRTQTKEYTTGTLAKTWDFRYQGDAIVEDKLTDSAHPAGTVVRTYVVDEDGSVVKMTIPAGESSAGTYLVTWNGHGDALALWQIDGSTGALTLANSYTYTTWGAPTTTAAAGFSDLGFRYLYVGEYDVQWDNPYNLGLVYMHARHYSPALGRFLQPDPDASEANLYAYAANNPVTQVDPAGTCFIICAIVNAVVDTAIYLATTDSKDWSVSGVASNAAVGFATGFIGIGLLSKFAKIGRIASALSKVTSGVSRIGERAGGMITRLFRPRITAFAHTAGPAARRFTPDQDALIQLAKGARRRGPINRQEADILDSWRREYRLPGHGPMFHERFPTHGTHINVGPVRHIRIDLR
jgi:RHS repeat-associated protein